MAVCWTNQVGSNKCPQMRLVVNLNTGNPDHDILDWVLDYVGHGMAPSTNGQPRSWTVSIDGQNKSGSLNINGQSGTFRVASGQVRVNKLHADHNIGFSISFAMNITWHGSATGTVYGSGAMLVGTKHNYPVSYNANGGSGAPSGQTKWYGESLTLSGTRPTRTGHTFAGWATSASGAVAYQPGATYTGNAAITLYAKWTANTWKVSYNANGGTGAPAAQTKTYGQTLKLSSTKPTRANYNFLGWGTSAGSTTVAYAAGANYTANSSITLYAVWKLAWKAPQITGLSAARCDSAGTLKEDGTCAKISFKWATDKTIKSIAIVCNGVTTNVANLTGTSGAVNQVVGANKLSTESSYQVKVTVTDQTGGSTVTTTVAPLSFLVDFKAGGKGAAFGKPATMDSTVDFAWNVYAEKNLTVLGSFIQMVGGRARSFFRPFAGDANGDGIKIGQGGSVVIGSGESADAYVSGASLSGADETIRLCSDAGIYAFTNMQNGYASRKQFSFESNGNFTAPGQVKGGSGNFPSATINNLSWTGAGLKGMVFKQLWSGNLSAGGSVTVPDLSKYNVFLLVSNYNQGCLAARHYVGATAGAGIAGGASAQGVVANCFDFNANGNTFKLNNAASVWTNNTGSVTKLNVTKIIGIL